MAIEGYTMPSCGIYNASYFNTNDGTWNNTTAYTDGCGGGDIVGDIPNDNTEHIIYGNPMGKITVQVFQRWNYSGTVLSRANLRVYALVNGVMTMVATTYMGEMNSQQIVFAIDEEAHLGYCNFWGMMNYYSPGFSQRIGNGSMSTADKQALYAFLKAYVTYQWTSVPAISGKMGILSLPVLIDTDGNPVSNGSASDFSTLPDSVKVRTLADLAVQ